LVERESPGVQALAQRAGLLFAHVTERPLGVFGDAALTRGYRVSMANEIEFHGKSSSSVAWRSRLLLALFGLRQKHRKRRDHDYPPLVKNPVAHGERTHDSDPNLAGFL